MATLAPDVILAHGSSTVGPLLQVTRTVPIVFPVVSDPVAAGFIDTLARPGGNATGFMSIEYSTGGKWLQLLKQIAPNVTRAAVFRDSAQGGGTSHFAAIQAVAPSLEVEVSPLNVREAGEIERTVGTFSRTANGGMVVASGSGVLRHRQLIVSLAARHKLPASLQPTPVRRRRRSGFLQLDQTDQYRRAADYVDRILEGEKPADLPVQAPTKFETVINLKTAKAIGLTIPATALAMADEVIE